MAEHVQKDKEIRTSLLLDQELLRARSIAIVNIYIRPLTVHAVGVRHDLHALIRVDHRADRFRHPVVEPFLGIAAVATPQLDVVAIIGVAINEIDAQVVVTAHLDDQAGEIPLFGHIDIVLRPQLDIGAILFTGVRVHRKAGRQNRDDVLDRCQVAHRRGARDLPLLVVIGVLAIPQLEVDIGGRRTSVGGIPAFT